MDRDKDGRRQSDISHSGVAQTALTPSTELKRRYHRFVRHFGSAGIELERQPRREAAHPRLATGRSGLRRLKRRFRDLIRSAVMT